MIIPENDPIRSKKDVAAAVGADHDSKPKKPVTTRKEFKEVLDDSNRNMEDFEETTGMLKTNPDGQKQASLMAMFGKSYTKAKLTDPSDQKMMLEEGAEITPYAELKGSETSLVNPNQTNAHLKVKKEVESSLIKEPDLKLGKISSTSYLKQEPLESPSKLFSNLKPNSEKVNDDADATLPLVSLGGKESDPLTKKDKFNFQYTTAQADISYLNPNSSVDAVNPINLATNIKVEQKVPLGSPIHDLVVELIEKLTIVQLKGQTDTIITLNNPGVFKGVIIVMSQFDTANGQLNLAFENLTSQGKALLDNLASRDSLINILSEKGYMVQSFITTTITEHKPIISTQAESQFSRAREDNPRDEQGEKKQ